MRLRRWRGLAKVYDYHKPLTKRGLKKLYFNSLSVLYVAANLIVFPAALYIIAHTASASGSSYSASDVLGQPDFHTNGVGPSGLAGPSGSAIDTVHHRFFAADRYNDRILVYNLTNSNAFSGHAASYVIGQADFTGQQHNGGMSSTNQAGMYFPYDISYDSANQRLFVTDSFNGRVLVFDLSSGITNGMNASYVLGQSNFTNGSTSTAQNRMNFPEAVDYESSTSTLYVSDTGANRVLVFDLSGGITNGMNASYVLGQTDFTSGGNAPTQSGMCHPYKVSYDPTNHLLFEPDQCANRILVFDLSGGITNGMNASYVLGQSNFTTNSQNTTQSGMKNTSGTAYDPLSKQLFVPDQLNARVLIFDLSGGITNGMNASYVLGQSNFTSNNPSTSQSGMQTPFNIAYDPGTAKLFVPDDSFSSSRILIFDLSGGITNGMNASDVLGQLDSNGQPVFDTGGSNNWQNTDLGGYLEGGNYIDKVHHRLFVATCGGWVNIYTLDSNNNLTSHSPTNIIGSHTNFDATQSTMSCVSGLAYDSVRNYLFVSDASYSRILVFNLSGDITNGMNASYVLGQPDFVSSSSNQGGSPSANDLYRPWGGLALDPATNYLYVGDNHNQRILVFNTTSLSNDMNASYVLGQPDFVSSGSNITQNGLSYPYGMTLDTANHRLFVADWGAGERIMVFDTSNLSNGMNASYELGETDFTSSNSAADTGSTPDAKSFGPSGLAYDSVSQKLFVEDDDAYRVLVFDLSGGIANGMNASGVLGQPDFTSGTSSTCLVSQTNICDPEGISDYYDTGNNRLYLSDSSNARVLIFNFAKLISSIPSGTIGSSYSVGSLGSQTQGTTTYSLTSGALPPGVVLSTSTGALRGTPTSSGTYNFGVSVSDNNGSAGTYNDSHSYSLAIDAASGGSPSSKKSSNGNNKANTTPTDIVLNSFSDFFTSSGVSLSGLKVGDSLHLCIKASDTGSASSCDTNSPNYHSITIKGIDLGTDSATLTFASSAFDEVFYLNQAKAVSFNQSNTNDIEATLTNLTATTADFTFKNLSKSTAAIINNTQNNPAPAITAAASKSANHRLWYVGGGVVIIILGTWLIKRKKRITKTTSY